MEQIEMAIRSAYAKRQKYLFEFLLCGVFIAICAVLEPLKGDARASGLVLSAAALILIAVVLYIINNRIKNKRNPFMESKLFRELERLGYAKEFIESIDAEMQNDLIINYNYDIYRLNLFVTKTWLIYISTKGSIIRKVSDISGARRRFISTRSKHALCIEFIDGSIFSNMCGDACDHIIELFQKELPAVVSQHIGEDHSGHHH